MESIDQFAEKDYLYNLISEHTISFHLLRSLISLNNIFSFLCRVLAHHSPYLFPGI